MRIAKSEDLAGNRRKLQISDIREMIIVTVFAALRLAQFP
jgi:hypothetical protein